MNIRGNFCKIVNPMLGLLGFNMSVTKRDDSIVPTGALSQEQAVDRIKWMRDHLGFCPESIVDIGASDGRWAVPAMNLFPDARFLLVEPLDDRREALTKIMSANSRVAYCQALLGQESGRVKFMKDGHRSSIFGNSEGQAYGEVMEMDVLTLDQLIAKVNFPGPDLIKLDIEGSELLALKGAPKALASAEIVEMEVSFLPFKKGIALFHEIVTFMASKGYRVFDVYGVYGRSLDGMPIQGECIFIKQNTSLIKDYRWANGIDWS